MIKKLLYSLLCFSLISLSANAQVVKDWQKISDIAGGFGGGGGFNDFTNFGRSAVAIGDLDSDGVEDLAVGAPKDDAAGWNHGSVAILFMNADGTVKKRQRINDKQGGFSGVLRDRDIFGSSLANLGDMNGDGIEDLAVGAYLDDDGGEDRGAVWILFLYIAP